MHQVGLLLDMQNKTVAFSDVHGHREKTVLQEAMHRLNEEMTDWRYYWDLSAKKNNGESAKYIAIANQELAHALVAMADVMCEACVLAKDGEKQAIHQALSHIQTQLNSYGG